MPQDCPYPRVCIQRYLNAVLRISLAMAGIVGAQTWAALENQGSKTYDYVSGTTYQRRRDLVGPTFLLDLR